MTARKVARQQARIQAALDGKPAPDVEWEAANAFRLATKRIAAPIARELCLDEKTLQDWGNIESGDRPPNLTVLYVTQLALAMRPLPSHRAECFAAVDFIERQLGRVAFDLPTGLDRTRDDGAKIAHALMQFAEFISAVGNQPPSTADLARAHRELSEINSACAALLSAGRVSEGKR